MSSSEPANPRAGPWNRWELLPLLLSLLSHCCELSSAVTGAQKEQKAGESPTVPWNPISCEILSPHSSDFKIIGTWWYWKSQVNTSKQFKDCQELSLFFGSKNLTSTEEHCYEMINTSSKSQESILLEFIAQPNSTEGAHENITVTCTPSCSSLRNTFSVNCTLKRKPSVQDSKALYSCHDIKPSALLTCQARNSTLTVQESVGTAIAILMCFCTPVILVIGYIVAVKKNWLRSKHQQRNPQQSALLEKEENLSTTGSMEVLPDVTLHQCPQHLSSVLSLHSFHSCPSLLDTSLQPQVNTSECFRDGVPDCLRKPDLADLAIPTQADSSNLQAPHEVSESLTPILRRRLASA